MTADAIDCITDDEKRADAGVVKRLNAKMIARAKQPFVKRVRARRKNRPAGDRCKLRPMLHMPAKSNYSPARSSTRSCSQAAAHRSVLRGHRGGHPKRSSSVPRDLLAAARSSIRAWCAAACGPCLGDRPTRFRKPPVHETKEDQ